MDLSVIIVSYNTKDDLHACLDSVYSHTQDLQFEVIVVDNSSHDGSPDMVKQLFPQVKIIESPANLGFGKANNLGAKQAKGEFILFLNPDTLFFNNALKLSIDQARALPKLGAFSCRLLNQDKSIQPSGGYFPTLISLYAWQLWIDEIPILNLFLKPVHPPASFYRRSFQPDWLTGAFLLIPTNLFRKLGGFDEHIFMYGEELCYRLRQNGSRIYYSHHPSIVHLQGKSSTSHFALVNEVKGIKYFFSKHYPSWQTFWVNLAFRLGSLLRLAFFGIIMGNGAKKAIYLDILRS